MKSLVIGKLPALDYSSQEALNTLYTNLTFSGGNVRKVLATSCQSNEGKSYLTMHLMRTIANNGKRVVLVDADLRKSVLVSRHWITAESRIAGLSHFLAGMADIQDILYETNIENAWMIPAGQPVVNSLPLLSTQNLPYLLDMLIQKFDFVLIDAPPVGMLIDAAQIARHCDGVMFVVANNETTKRELNAAKQQIEATGCPILGAVLNKITFDSRSAKNYYYKTYYQHNSKAQYDKPHRQRKKKIG